jgi:putative methionine-R-sulfoxide reductase with GAF domain
VWAVLDIDSREFNAFDEDDRIGLEALVQCIVSDYVYKADMPGFADV